LALKKEGHGFQESETMVSPVAALLKEREKFVSDDEPPPRLRGHRLVGRAHPRVEIRGMISHGTKQRSSSGRPYAGSKRR
jgi:hypothetical protein